jgi:putative glycosyltransferase (TIGR04372 family)
MFSRAWLDSLKARIRRHPRTHRAIAALLRVILRALSVPLYLARVRFLRFTAFGRIGHLAAEPDIFIKERMLGMRNWCYGVILSPPGAAANECLLEYWRRYIKVVRSPLWLGILWRFQQFPYLCFAADRYTLAINETAPSVAVQAAWGNRAALLALSARHRREGRALLSALGVPAAAEIVCFHCRDEGYSPSDEALHSFRNCDIENYLPAVAELAKLGYWCIRMGDPTMRRLLPMERVLDYAHLEIRSDWMDVFLCANCRFFLGSPSGLSEVASVFGRPCAMANQAPLSTVLKFGFNDVAIPKLLWSEEQGRYLGFREIFDSEIANFRFTNLYRERGLRLVENTGEDIRDLALEVLQRSGGGAAYSPEDEERQRRFKALMRPGHYSYGGVTRVGRDFLRKHAALLDAE